LKANLTILIEMHKILIIKVVEKLLQ